MQLVIEISDGLYNNLSTIKNGSIASKIILDCIKNSTPLPKGHGNLIDTNELIENGVATESYLNTFIKTIIEADNKENNK